MFKPRNPNILHGGAFNFRSGAVQKAVKCYKDHDLSMWHRYGPAEDNANDFESVDEFEAVCAALSTVREERP